MSSKYSKASYCLRQRLWFEFLQKVLFVVFTIFALLTLLYINIKDKDNDLPVITDSVSRGKEIQSQTVEFESVVRAVNRILIQYDKQNIDIAKRNLVVVHIGSIEQSNSLDVFVNNIKVFTSSIMMHTTRSDQQAIYWFNVVGGESNPLFQFIPRHLSNVVSLEWSPPQSVSDTHLRTIHLLGEGVVRLFASVIFTSHATRGPMVLRSNGAWLSEYRRLLDQNNVGMVGSTLSCEKSPHVQSHIFVLSAAALRRIINWPINRNISTRSEVARWSSEVALTKKLLDSGFNVSSILYDRRFGQPFFTGRCASTVSGRQNPTSWCDLTSAETIFTKWGGESLQLAGYMCEGAVEAMQGALVDLARHEPAIGLVIPETLVGGPLYDLYREYTLEKFMYQRNRAQVVTTQQQVVRMVEEYGASLSPKVCFLVRTAGMHDSEARQPNSTAIEYGLRELAKSLIAQSNPHWLAFVFKTDPSPFEERLQQILSRFKDERLRYLPLEPQFLPTFTKAGSAYGPTDEVLRRMMREWPQCRWLSATNGDNVYGSGVVEGVMSAPKTNPLDGKPVSMVLAPIDSRNFAEQDYLFRREKLNWFKRDKTKNKPPKASLRNWLLPKKKLRNEWEGRCAGLRANVELNLLTYVTQPRPKKGRVDLASVFFLNEALARENVLFGNFTNPTKYPCLGCQDGYLTEYLVRNRLWSYVRLPIDGLKSIVFHGPAPTLCIASGNVWFDHPDVDKVGCYSHQAVTQLHASDGRGKDARYDWTHFYKSDPRLCLRLSKHSFPLEPVSAGNG